MNYKKIPLVLKEKAQWVLYEIIQEVVNGKIKLLKYPIQLSGKFASVNNPKTWGSFADVVKAKETADYDGIGYVLTDKDLYVGIDFDNCINEEGQLSEEVLRIVERLDSYTEVSPSGTGIHVIVKADLSDYINGSGMKKDGVICEIYTSLRFFTMTGEVLLNKHDINEATEVVKELITEYYPEKLKSQQVSQNVKEYPRLKVSKERVLKKMFNSKYGKDIRALYNGKVDGNKVGKSPSEIDFTLCKHLAFWCRKDKLLMKEILLDSKLNRDKFYRVDLGQKCYLDTTIDAACKKQKKVFNKKY